MRSDLWLKIQRLRLDAPDWFSRPTLRILAREAAERAGEIGLAEAPERACLDTSILARAWLRRVQGELRARGGVAG
jgi:hypothetical protein